MMNVRCGILFNGRQNLFLDYLVWIVNTSKIKNFELSYVHTNNEELVKDLDINLGTYENVIENSDIVFSLGYW